MLAVRHKAHQSLSLPKTVLQQLDFSAGWKEQRNSMEDEGIT
jgi:hypothetical protein